MSPGPVSSIALHMDSLGWAAGREARALEDPTWLVVLDRFLELCERKGFPLTLFVIGRDMENRGARERVAELARDGHEIASHSYEHRMDLGALAPEELRFEIREAHEAITAAAGEEPRGFAAPGWNRSPALLAELGRAGYLYDASLFPSWLMLPMLAKLLWNFRGHHRRGEVIARGDALSWALGDRLSRRRSGDPIELSVPTTRWLRVACWHTLSFVCPGPLFDAILNSCLRRPWFMYIVHPADLLDPRDVPPALQQGARIFERLSVPLELKRRRLEEVLDRILAESEEVVTCEKMALSIRGASGSPPS